MREVLTLDKSCRYFVKIQLQAWCKGVIMHSQAWFYV